MESFEVTGKVADVVAGRVFEGTVQVENGLVTGVREHAVPGGPWILPGLIDAHVHIESSMLLPSEFARLASVHGTTGTVSDPHEIANVMGMEGVRFMIRNGHKVPFRFSFGAPSCVPATPFETSGAVLGPEEVEELLKMPEIRYLSEMMNYPGVLSGDPAVMAKLRIARSLGRPVDGHAPGLTGTEAEQYIGAGISTDHECFTLEEALEKIGFGMKILIREGSAARNFDVLWPLIDRFPGQVMLCSDDKHPDDLVRGHINDLVRRALSNGCDLMNVLRACTLNPVRHYGIPAGLLQPGDPADLIVVDDLERFGIRTVYIGGQKVAEDGCSLIPRVLEEPANVFHASQIDPKSLRVQWSGGHIRVIQAYDGQLITGVKEFLPAAGSAELAPDPGQDILKLAMKNRYTDRPPAVAFVSGFGLKHGALASSVSHDSHNVVGTGTDDESLAHAMNLVIRNGGGIAALDGKEEVILPLPFAGIMSGEDGYQVATWYQHLEDRAHLLGSNLHAPFMTLSFMGLLVIPELKLSDLGLFNGKKFEFTSLGVR